MKLSDYMIFDNDKCYRVSVEHLDKITFEKDEW